MFESKRRVLSCVQPTGGLHIGNYLGAIKHFIDLQNLDEFETIYGVVDLHSITAFQDPEQLSANTFEVLALFLACGCDPISSILFRQSDVEFHTELCWIFSCIVRMGWLNRMTQFKEKNQKNVENSSLGLYAYPVLMASDILVYKATHVPVGDDQKQHLELCWDIAQKFNFDYRKRINKLFDAENYFTQVKPIIPKDTKRIMSLNNASRKMSKSELNSKSRIEILDPKDVIKSKIKSAKTDLEAGIPDNLEALAERPEVFNLLSIYAGCLDISMEQAVEQQAGKNYKDFKSNLTDVLINKFSPIRMKMLDLLNDRSYLLDVFNKGKIRASEIAEVTCSEVKQILGLK